MTLWIDMALVLALNVPFGYWRGNVKKFSPQWFLAVHVPVVFAILIRVVSGLPFEPLTLAAMVLVFFTGQTVGKKLRMPLAGLIPTPLTSCLALDLKRMITN